MKLHISNRGDRSVGIEPDFITVDWNADFAAPDTEERSELREAFQSFFATLIDGPVFVQWDDELQAEAEAEEAMDELLEAAMCAIGRP